MKFLVAATLLWLGSINAEAKGDPKIGEAKSATCVACHGAKGVSPNDLWPNLAGQKKGYLVKQMKDFKSGSRKDPVMTSQAMIINDADIEHIAAYYSSLK